jgi:hypothetical protein
MLSKRISIALVFFFFAELSLLAKSSNFQPGYVITLQNDTLRGLINFDSDAGNAKRCRFKNSDGSEEKTYLPGTILGFRFTNAGKYYVSKNVRIGEKDVDLFLEYLVKGILSVYYYDNGDLPSYFFEQEDGKMLLVSKDPEKVVDGQYVQNMKYDSQLRALFKDYVPKVYQKHPIDFSQSTMIGMAKAYHAGICTTGEECIVFESKHPDSGILQFDFSVYAGMQFLQYTITNIPYKDISKPMVASFCPVFGGTMEVSYPRSSQSLSLVVDASVSQFSTEKRFVSSSIQAKSEGKLFSARLGLKYKFVQSKLSPFAQIGYAMTGLLNPKCTVDSYILDSHDRTFEYDMKKMFQGVVFGLGLDYKFKKHSLYCQFFYDHYFITDKPADKLRMQRIALGYTF